MRHVLMAVSQNTPEEYLEVGITWEKFRCFKTNHEVQVVIALTKVSLLKLDRHAFRYVMDMTPGLQSRLEKLSNIRVSRSWRAVDLNSVFSRLGSSQKAQLQAILRPYKVKAGDVLWTQSKPALTAYLIGSGELEFLEIREELGTPFTSGAFLCNIISMLSHFTGEKFVHSEDMSGRRTKEGNEKTVDERFNKLLSNPSKPPDRRYTGFLERSSLSGRETEPPRRRWRESFSVGDQHKRMPSFLVDKKMGSSASVASVNISRDSNASEGTNKSIHPSFATSGVTLAAKTDCELFYVEPEDMIEYLEQNPGIFINLIDSLVLE